MEHGHLVANLKNTHGFGKTFTSVEILEAAKESAGRLRALLSGILMRDAPISGETFQVLLALKANQDANLSSKTMALSEESKSVLSVCRASQAWQEADKAFYAVIAKHDEGR